jgi:hypothetical protein
MLGQSLPGGAALPKTIFLDLIFFDLVGGYMRQLAKR